MNTLLMVGGIFFSTAGNCDSGRCTPVRTVAAKVVTVVESRPRIVRRCRPCKVRIVRRFRCR